MEAETGVTRPHSKGHQVPPNQEEAGRTLRWGLQRKRGPVDILISGSWPPELGDDTFLLF